MASVDWRLIAFVCVAMILTTDLLSPLQKRTTFMLLLNVVVRLSFPSQYCPATASQSGIIAHPFTARCIAFIAEFCMYEVWAVWIGVEFWGDSTNLWLVVLVGEILSTTGVLVQNELILFFEDCTWTVHALYMLYLSQMKFMQVLIFGGLGGYLLLCHLPSRFERLLHKMRKYDNSLWHTNPLFTSGKVIIKVCSDKEKLWVVPMLLGMPCLMFIMYRDINHTV